MTTAESLLCNELWLTMTPKAEHDQPVHAYEEEHEHHRTPNTGYHCSSFSYSNVEDCEGAFLVFLQKEIAYALGSDYMKHVQENCRIDRARFRAIHWFIKSQRRLNLSLETVFNAANYFDRLCSLKKCQVWNDWMFELLTVACLSTASKFNEIDPPSMHQIQMEGLENLFESSLIQRMELNLLKALEWRLRPTTSYSYIELLTGSSTSFDVLEYNKVYLVQEIHARVTEILVNALLDSKFLEFLPSVIAMSALQHISKEFFSTKYKNEPDSLCMGRLRALIPPDQKENLIKCCQLMMEEELMDKNRDIHNPATKVNYHYYCNCHSSPATVLACCNAHWCCDFCDCHPDGSLLKMQNIEYGYFRSSNKKRKREEQASLAACSV